MSFPRAYILAQILINVEWSIICCDEKWHSPQVTRVMLYFSCLYFQREIPRLIPGLQFTAISFYCLTSTIPATCWAALEPLPTSTPLHFLFTELNCALTKTHFQLYHLYLIHKADVPNKLCKLPVEVGPPKWATDNHIAEGTKGGSSTPWKSAWKEKPHSELCFTGS